MLHRADESQPARNSCPRLPHFVDSRFGLYHVAVVLSFLRSPALQKFESFNFDTENAPYAPVRTQIKKIHRFCKVMKEN